jgi:hypothetical protein
MLAGSRVVSVNDDEEKGWLADLSDTYGSVRLWAVGLLGPGLVMSELLQGRVAFGVGLGFALVIVWMQLVKRLGVESAWLDRAGHVFFVLGGILMVWHYARWWAGYLG